MGKGERNIRGKKKGAKDPWVECFGIPRLELDWSIQTTKILVTPMRVISMGVDKAYRCWEVGKIVDHTGYSIRNLHLLVTL